MRVAITTLTLFVAVAFAVAGPATAATYPSLAPLTQYYSADDKSEISLARSAAPATISGDATILIFTRFGYQTAKKGTNGFTCLVERAWMKSFDDDQFWNPTVRAPVCYNAAASRTVVPYTRFRTELILVGKTRPQILDRVRAAVKAKYLPPVEPGAMAYMMSKVQYLDDRVKAWHSHIMIYAPKSNGADSGAGWGADRHGSPVVYDSGHLINPEPWALFFVPVAHWSDGSQAPLLHM